MKTNEVNKEVDVNCKKIRMAKVFEILAAVFGEILTLLCVSLIFYGLAAMEIICNGNISSFSEISNSQIFFSSSYIVIMLCIVGNFVLCMINNVINKWRFGKTFSKMLVDLGCLSVVLFLNKTSALAFLLNRKEAAFSALMLILFLIVVKTLAASIASRLNCITHEKRGGINSVPEPELNAHPEK